MTNRIIAFVIVCAVCIVATIGYALATRTIADDPNSAVPVADPTAVADIISRPHVVFRHTDVGRAHGKLAIVPLDQPDGSRLITSLSCERIYAAAGTGLCLSAKRGMITTYRADLLDATYQSRYGFSLAGVPSRARVSRDGRRAGLTFFVSGDSYASGGFSTRTLLVDGTSGQSIANLEEFAITKNDAPFKSVDFNFWGITFQKTEPMFFATLASGGTIYLIEGNASTRTARVVRSGIECPSLSPDNRRIAFKRRMPGLQLLWRVYVLDLETGQEIETAETRHVDDQMEWLDDNTLLYALPKQVQKANASMDVWAVAADGSGQPRLFIENAESPAVVRP